MYLAKASKILVVFLMTYHINIGKDKIEFLLASSFWDEGNKLILLGIIQIMFRDKVFLGFKLRIIKERLLIKNSISIILKVIHQ